MSLERVAHGVRLGLAPERIDEAVMRDDPVRLQQQDREPVDDAGGVPGEIGTGNEGLDADG